MVGQSARGPLSRAWVWVLRRPSSGRGVRPSEAEGASRRRISSVYPGGTGKRLSMTSASSVPLPASRVGSCASGRNSHRRIAARPYRSISNPVYPFGAVKPAAPSSRPYERVHGAGEFEVDETDVAVGTDDQVAGVEVSEDDPASVHRPEDVFDPVHDGDRLAGVLGDHDFVGVGMDQRVLRRQPLTQGLSFDELLHQEAVFPHGQQFVQDGDTRQSGQADHHVVFLLEPRDGVDPALVQPRVRAGLLQHHLRTVGLLAGKVDTARVGEVQDPLHRVGQ